VAVSSRWIRFNEHGVEKQITLEDESIENQFDEGVLDKLSSEDFECGITIAGRDEKSRSPIAPRIYSRKLQFEFLYLSLSPRFKEPFV
jgi:hypothetical protein